MANVLKVTIDPDIKLEGVDDMPDDIKGNLLVNITLACKKYNCHWTEIVWSVKMVDNQPVIRVNRR